MNKSLSWNFFYVADNAINYFANLTVNSNQITFEEAELLGIPVFSSKSACKVVNPKKHVFHVMT